MGDGWWSPSGVVVRRSGAVKVAVGVEGVAQSRSVTVGSVSVWSMSVCNVVGLQGVCMRQSRVPLYSWDSLSKSGSGVGNVSSSCTVLAQSFSHSCSSSCVASSYFLCSSSWSLMSFRHLYRSLSYSVRLKFIFTRSLHRKFGEKKILSN